MTKFIIWSCLQAFSKYNTQLITYRFLSEDIVIISQPEWFTYTNSPREGLKDTKPKDYILLNNGFGAQIGLSLQVFIT